MKKSNRKRKGWKGFTLVEMLIVLLIIGLLVLIFIPNLGNTKKTADRTSGQAIEKVVDTQIELYRVNHNMSADENPTRDNLIKKGYLTKEQFDAYDNYQKIKEEEKNGPN